jgi:hypothetical protein
MRERSSAGRDRESETARSGLARRASGANATTESGAQRSRKDGKMGREAAKRSLRSARGAAHSAARGWGSRRSNRNATGANAMAPSPGQGQSKVGSEQIESVSAKALTVDGGSLILSLVFSGEWRNTRWRRIVYTMRCLVIALVAAFAGAVLGGCSSWSNPTSPSYGTPADYAAQERQQGARTTCSGYADPASPDCYYPAGGYAYQQREQQPPPQRQSPGLSLELDPFGGSGSRTFGRGSRLLR